MKLLFTILITLVSFTMQGQSKEKDYILPYGIPSIKSHYTAEGAKKDIMVGTIKILFPGGFGGIPNFDNYEDRKFQKTYNVEFFSQGCLRQPEGEDEEGYNAVMFAYLDEQFGIGWRDKIRKGAIGLEP